MNNKVVTLPRENHPIQSVQPAQNKQPVGSSTKFEPNSFQELILFSDRLARTNFVPKNYRGKPNDILCAIQMGAELGLSPMLSLQNIAVINDRPSIYGDAMLAICKASPLCESIEEYLDGDQSQIETLTAICKVRRRGFKNEITGSFSWEDAKKAGLATKAGAWLSYPKRMLQMRARGFALRDAFPDLLNGLITREEANDYQHEENGYIQKDDSHTCDDNNRFSNQIDHDGNGNLSSNGIEDKYERCLQYINTIETTRKLEDFTLHSKFINLCSEISPEQKERLYELVNQKADSLNQESNDSPKQENHDDFIEEMPDC
ncbi:recombinase family protein [Commensalibacter melissae]|uniref:hypothetical protein n=1 Tax=Commensalibacter melissae TaxID=2070537 RepID=UPI0012D9AB36|nr:hypothetical protein [Commensalibacter melissae]MUH05376.1 hypothetical protein [Commensalibacter melissae]